MKNLKIGKIKHGKKYKLKKIAIVSSISVIACAAIISTKYKEKQENATISYEEEAETITSLTNEKEEVVELTQVENLILVNDTKHLESLLGVDKPITYDDIYAALDNNKNLDFDDMIYIRMYVDKLKEKLPNINLTCLYYNIKDLKFIYDSKEEFEEEFPGVEAYFNFNTKELHFKPDYYHYDGALVKNYFLYHEFTHMLNSLMVEKDGKIIVRKFNEYTTSRGIELDEGFDDYIVSQILQLDSEILSYPEEASIVSGLINNLDDYSINDYFEKDIYYLIDKLPIDDPTNFVDMLDSIYYSRNTQDIEKINEYYNEIYKLMIDIYYINRYNNNNDIDTEYKNFMKSINYDEYKISGYEETIKNKFYNNNLKSNTFLSNSETFNITGYSEIINDCGINNIIYHVYINDLNQVYFGPYLITDMKTLYNPEDVLDMELVAIINGSSYLKDYINNTNEINLDYNNVICNQDLLVQYYQDILVEEINNKDSKTLVK